MSYIVGKKIDKSLVEVVMRDVLLQQLQEAIVANKGGVVEDYSFYEMTAEDVERCRDGWSHTYVWENSNMVSIDFSSETSKPWVKVFTDKTSIVDDGVDTATITLEFWKANLSSIQTNINLTGRRFPIFTPSGIRFVRLNVVNGVARARFRCAKAGEYVFPSELKRHGTIRVFNQVSIEVDETSLLELF